ncbi:hypothetical protein [Martelella soudanensis]|uniref:hypothetical protein n=1 Tax=unclassified Martelella TaxID=2629616 RepID=UPI0015DDD269|nr:MULTISPECIES: hypothetical protein [unclassified Martelella]
MIAFQTLPDDHPDLALPPLLRGACLILTYAAEHGGIGLTATKAFKRDFVRWAVENFEWPGKSAEEMFRYQSVINEADFPPVDMLHFLLIRLRLGRHYKGMFRVTSEGKELGVHPGQLFKRLISFFVLNIDHAAYSRLGEGVFGNWDVWLNVMNVEIEDGASEDNLFSCFFGEAETGNDRRWREVHAFGACVLKPLEWSGLITVQELRDQDNKLEYIVTKTALWRSGLKLETDDLVQPVTRH